MSQTFRNQELSWFSQIESAEVKLKGVRRVTVSVNPANLVANADAETSVTIKGVETGDFVMVLQPAALEAGLLFVGARISAADTVAVRLRNVTAGAIDGAARNWEFLVFDLT